MSKESDFLIYCMERYRHFKGLSGADVAKIFNKYGIYGYITKYFESLHTMGDHYIVQDIIRLPFQLHMCGFWFSCHN